MKASTTLLLLLGSISLSEAVRIEQRHQQQAAPSLNELVQTVKTDKTKTINLRKDQSESLVEIESPEKFSAKEELNKNAKVAKLSQMEEALQQASKQVHQQAEQEEVAHKSQVASSALSQLKNKQMLEERHLKTQLAAEEKRRMKELREGEEYARKVDQAELDRANQEILAQERSTQMKELQEIEAEQRKDADKEEQEFLAAQAIQETKALAAKKAAQKAKIARIKRKHELERHNAEAKLQLFKMQQQEEAETALKDEEAVLEATHEVKEDGELSDQMKLEAILNKGREEAQVSIKQEAQASFKQEAQATNLAVEKKPTVKKTNPEVEKIVKEKGAEVDNMKDKNCETEKKVKQIETGTKKESNLKKVLQAGLKEKKEDIVKMQKDLNDEYAKEQADLAKFETNKGKSAVFRDIEVRAHTLQDQNKRDKYADELNKEEEEKIAATGSKAEVKQAPNNINQTGAKDININQAGANQININQAGAKEIKDETNHIGSEVKSDISSKINEVLKGKNESPLTVGEGAIVKPETALAKPTEPAAAVVKADKTPQAPVAATAVPVASQASKEMKDKQAAMDKMSKADKEKTIKLKDSLKKELKLFSVSLNENNYDNAIKIRQQLSELGEESSFNVNTDEIFRGSFTFPQLANNDFAQEMFDQLQETQNLLAQTPENETNKESFIKKALYVGTQLSERYKNKWVNPNDNNNHSE